MATANASLGVRCDHWKIAVARAERLENMRSRRVSFSVGNSQKLLGATSGEYGAWGTTSKLLSMKNWWARAARWGGAFSWWKNTAAAFLGRFSRNAGRNFVQDGVHRSNGYADIGSYLFHSQAAVFHNHLFHSRNHVFRSASAWPRLLRFVFTQRSVFFELSYPWTHIFYVHNASIACLTQLLMNFDGFHATQMEESDNHALFFERMRRNWSI